MMLSHNPIVEPFALAHATIVTGDKAGTILRNMTIVVGADGRIEQVAPSIETSIPAEYHYLDGTGKIVMPGLINAHTHLFSQGKPLNPKLATPKGQRMVATFAHSPLGKPYMAATVKHNATTLLESGVTTIRTLGDVGYEVVTLRDQIDAGQILGPRILASGPLMAIPEGHGAPLIALTSGTPEEARTAVAQNLKAGVNAIKIAATGITDIQLENSKNVVGGMVSGARQAHEAGLMIGVGTDTGMTFVPQYATWRELELLVAYAGFSPAEALHAATAVNASILGVDAETGSLEVGKSADLLVLNANPLDDLRALEHPALVIAAGHPVWRPSPKRFADIDALLDEAYA